MCYLLLKNVNKTVMTEWRVILNRQNISCGLSAKELVPYPTPSHGHAVKPVSSSPLQVSHVAPDWLTMYAAQCQSRLQVFHISKFQIPTGLVQLVKCFFFFFFSPSMCFLFCFRALWEVRGTNNAEL